MKTLLNVKINTKKDLADHDDDDDDDFSQDSLINCNDSTKHHIIIKKEFHNNNIDPNKTLPAVMALSIPIIIALSFFVLFLIKQRNRHIERLKIIEKGGDLSMLSFDEKTPRFFKKGGMIRNPFRLLGIGLGIFVGYIIEKYLIDADFVGYASAIIVFMVIGSIIDHHLFYKNNTTNNTHD